MNKFEYQITTVPHLLFNAYPSQEVSWEVSVSVSIGIGIAKEIERDKRVRCDVVVETLNLDTQVTDVQFKAISYFGISSTEVDEDSLFNDAKEYCIPISIKKAEEKFSEISKILIGRELTL